MTVSKRFVRTALLNTLLVASAAHSQMERKAFIPEEVFAGRSEGQGEMQFVLGKKRSFTVESLGTMQADGHLRLEQNVRFEGKAVQSRSWVMWQIKPGNYSATLTEAAGPVIVRTEGSRLTLRYPLTRWGLVMHQTLDLAKDGRTVANSGIIRFLGIPVGQLRETIRLKH